MAIIPQPFLFKWNQIDASSDLQRLSLVLDVLPDEKLMRHLETLRGNGRNEYPIRPCWNAFIAGIVFQHVPAASLLRELSRNAELRQICGFNPLAGIKAVPSPYAYSRFLGNLIRCESKIKEMFHSLVDSIGKILPGLGEKLAADTKALSSFGKPVKDKEKLAKRDMRRENDADKGVKTYKMEKADGTTYEKIVSWFGFKLHLLVDSIHELPLNFLVTKASASDTANLVPLVEDYKKHHPELIGHAKELAADKGFDSASNNKKLYEEFNIKPVIDTRKLWKDGEGTKPLYPERADNIVFNEKGEVFCYCPRSGECRKMSFAGFESDRRCQKFRCPAAAYDFPCKGRKECEEGRNIGEFGRIVRIPLKTDYRIFTPIPRFTEKWEKVYNRRTAIERVNSRIDRGLMFELHTIRGLAKMNVRIGLSLIILLATALGYIKRDQRQDIRKFVQQPMAA